MKNTKIISIDGLHRSGKGTQIRMLEEFLNDVHINAISLRGDGSINGAGKEIVTGNWDYATDVLNTEIYDAYNTNNAAMILLDRSLISRYFVLRQKGKTDYHDVLTFNHTQHGIRNTIIPDISFILHASKEVLLERNELTSDSKKYSFRKRNIIEYYDLFCSTVRSLEEAFNIKYLNAENTEEEVFNEMMQYLFKGGISCLK